MCNVILFWAVSVSVKHLEHCWAMILCLCTGTDLQDHGCSAAGAGWFCSPVSNNGYSQLLLRENPNSPRFFLRNTTLCRCRIVYPSNYFLFFFFLFNPWFLYLEAWDFLGFSHILPGLQIDALHGYPSFIIVQFLSAPCMIYAGYFRQRYSNADQAAGYNCSMYPWCRHGTGINSCTDAAGQNKGI